MLDLLKHCSIGFLRSLVKKHLNEPTIYHKFPFLIEKDFWNIKFFTQSYLCIAFELIFFLKDIVCLPKNSR